MGQKYFYAYNMPNRIKTLQHDDLGFSDSLEHAKKGEERPNHKYTARKWINGAWQYVYDTIGYGHKDKMQKADKLMDRASNGINTSQQQIDNSNKVLNEKVKNVESYKNKKDDTYKVYNEYLKRVEEANKKCEDEYDIVAFYYTGVANSDNYSSDAKRDIMRSISEQIPDIQQRIAKQHANFNALKEAHDKSEKAYQEYLKACKEYENAYSQYESSKVVDNKFRNENKNYKQTYESNKNVRNNEREAYEKSLAYKIDKGKDYVKKMFNK